MKINPTTSARHLTKTPSEPARYWNDARKKSRTILYEREGVLELPRILNPFSQEGEIQVTAAWMLAHRLAGANCFVFLSDF